MDRKVLLLDKEIYGEYFEGFNNYLFGKKVEIEGLSLEVSLGIWFTYFIIIMIVTFVNFKNKDIKNI